MGEALITFWIGRKHLGGDSGAGCGRERSEEPSNPGPSKDQKIGSGIFLNCHIPFIPSIPENAVFSLEIQTAKFSGMDGMNGITAER
jgi:hypothetical protein